jgi:hypothetical protein
LLREQAHRDPNRVQSTLHELADLSLHLSLLSTTRPDEMVSIGIVRPGELGFPVQGRLAIRDESVEP